MSGNNSSQFSKSIITPEIKEQVKARTSLVELIRPSVPDLKKKGKYFWGCCPFHREKTPSFHVREAEGNYYCFGCGASGDAISFTMEMQGLEFPAAVQELAERVGVVLEYEQVDPVAAQQKEDGFAVLEAANAFYQSKYASSASATYVHDKRALSAETVSTFNMGHAPDDWRQLLHHLQQAGYSAELIEKTGLCKTSDKAKASASKSEPYDVFRGRLMFPIRDLKQRVVGFGGRRLNNDEKSGPKYLNSPDTPFFNKGYMLYNLERAHDVIRRTGQALLVEGYMDVIALWQAGIHTAVAPLGTAITAEQVALLWRYCQTPTVCLDGDSAGQAAAVRVAKRVLPIIEPGKTLKFTFLADGEDPDTYIKKFGREAFLKAINSTLTLEEVLWRDLTDGVDLTVADSRAAVDAGISSLMNDVANGTLKTHLRRALKDKLWQAGRAGDNKGFSKNGKPKAIGPATAKAGFLPDVGSVGAARQMLALVCAQPEILVEFEESFFEISFNNQEDKQVFNEIVRFLTREGVAPADIRPYLLDGAGENHVQHLLGLVPEDELNDLSVASAAFRRLFNHEQLQTARRAQKDAALKGLQSGGSLDTWERMKQLRAQGRKK